MKRLFLLLLPVFSKGQAYDDSTGWVQPWLDFNGNIVEMSIAQLDARTAQADTLFFSVEFEFPPGQVPYRTTIRGNINLTFEPSLHLRCYAVKARSPTLGQVWQMRDPLNRPLDYLLIRGFKTLRITQTGFK